MALKIRVLRCWGLPLAPWDRGVWDIETGPIGVRLTGDVLVPHKDRQIPAWFRGVGHVWLETRNARVYVSDAEAGLKFHQILMAGAYQSQLQDVLRIRPSTLRRHLAAGINEFLVCRKVGKDVRLLLPSLRVPQVDEP